MNKAISSALFLTFAGLWSVQAYAYNCNVTATGVAFGIYNPVSGSDVSSAGTITFACSRDPGDPRRLRYTIHLSTGGSGSYTPSRHMSGPATLNYNLYTNASHSRIWGDGTGGSRADRGRLRWRRRDLSTQSRDHRVYGLLPAGQNVPAGSYSDTITATVLF